MKVLVTGHDGYIGSVLAPMLRKAGHDVIGLDTFFYQGCDFGEAPHLEPALRLDVRDVESVRLKGFDAVVHLAALSNDPLGDLAPAWTYAINFEGTISLARAAREAGVSRFIFASSCSMYGTAGDDAPLAEDAPLRPLTAYAESKVRAEEALRGLAGNGFAPVSMRNATAYGISPRLRLDVVLNNLVAWAHTTGSIRLLSDGMSWRPLVHVRDIARAALAILEAPIEDIAGQSFNIGSAEQTYRIRDLAEVVHRRLTRCEVTFAADASPDPRSYRVDFSKFASTFPDCEFAYTPERGVDELAGAYESVGLTREDFEGDRYMRLGRLKRLLKDGSLDDSLRWHAESERERTMEATGRPARRVPPRTADATTRGQQ
jgi:nucleoside-diphosphate-sugar epimerase